MPANACMHALCMMHGCDEYIIICCKNSTFCTWSNSIKLYNYTHFTIIYISLYVAIIECVIFHVGRGTVLERNEIYEASGKDTMTMTVNEEGGDTTSVEYESMDILSEAIQTEANNAYDRVDKAADIEDTYESVS